MAKDRTGFMLQVQHGVGGGAELFDHPPHRRHHDGAPRVVGGVKGVLHARDVRLAPGRLAPPPSPGVESQPPENEDAVV